LPSKVQVGLAKQKHLLKSPGRFVIQ